MLGPARTTLKSSQSQRSLLSDALVDPVIHITKITFAAGVAFGLGLAITPRLIDQKWDKSPEIMKVSTRETHHCLVVILVINFIILVVPPKQKSGVMKYIALLHNRLNYLLTFSFILSTNLILKIYLNKSVYQQLPNLVLV